MITDTLNSPLVACIDTSDVKSFGHVPIKTGIYISIYCAKGVLLKLMVPLFEAFVHQVTFYRKFEIGLGKAAVSITRLKTVSYYNSC